MGETLAIFHLSGKIPLCNDESKIHIKGFLITSEVCFKILTSMLSTPQNFVIAYSLMVSIFRRLEKFSVTF